MWHLIAAVWQGFADNGTRLLFAADKAQDEKIRTVLEKAAQFNKDQKASLDAAMAARGQDPAIPEIKWDE